MAISISSPIDVIPRQQPSHDLTDEECEVWAATVNDLPADWFSPATTPLLVQYCRHVVHARRIAGLIERAAGGKSVDIGQYDALLQMQVRESRAIALLATKMRVAQQSTTNHRGNKKTTTVSSPWEI